jgi:hypothetical protein
MGASPLENGGIANRRRLDIFKLIPTIYLKKLFPPLPDGPSPVK